MNRSTTPISDHPDIILIEDDAILGGALKERLDIEGWSCLWLKGAREVERHWQKVLTSRVIVCDMRLGDGHGSEIFQRTRDAQCSIPFILITAYASVQDAVSLMQQGLNDYWEKPFDIEAAISNLGAIFEATGGHQGEIRLGPSPAMYAIERLVARLSRSNVDVVITGESGSGKEVVANLLHSTSCRKDRPMVAVNCAAIPSELLESELFGYEKGAFTGAHRNKEGLIAQAHQGTLFFDEIGDMPLAMQAKILRVLQERTITPLGGGSPQKVDFRLICATHRNLPEMVRGGLFREDLFYRINIVHIPVPPLRERRPDIRWLARKILAKIPSHTELPFILLPDAEQQLELLPYPGNVRELDNLLRRGCALAPTHLLSAADLFSSLEAPPDDQAMGDAGTLRSRLDAEERRVISQALENSQHTITAASKKLGISRKNLWEKMRKHGLS